MNRFLLIASLMLTLSACSENAENTETIAVSGDDALSLITQEALYAHLAYLADDALEGREPGHEGYELAAKYVAEQYAEIGLEPGGSEEWYQPVELQSYLLDADSPAMTVHRDGGDVELKFRDQFLMYGDKVSTEDAVRGEVVYVGYGAHAPDYGYSDLDGVDLEGKIVAFRRTRQHHWRQACAFLVNHQQVERVGGPWRNRGDFAVLAEDRRELSLGARQESGQRKT